jgi:ATP-dependent DNA ligase
MAQLKIKARFIEPMLLQATAQLPDGPQFAYELKLDGFRAQAIKSAAKSNSARVTTRTSTGSTRRS